MTMTHPGSSDPAPGPTGRAARRARSVRTALLGAALVAAGWAPGCVFWDAVLGYNRDIDAETSHFTRLWLEDTAGEPYIGLSTEDGILLLTRAHFEVGDLFDVHFPIGNSIVRDWSIRPR